MPASSAAAAASGVMRRRAEMKVVGMIEAPVETTAMEHCTEKSKQ